VMYNDMRIGRFYYRGGRIEEEHRADQCTECGECLDACPQAIDIPEWLKKVHAELGPRPSQ
jgi:predicted aldo/keto reductase-like oxidoreductase